MLQPCVFPFQSSQEFSPRLLRPGASPGAWCVSIMGYCERIRSCPHCEHFVRASRILLLGSCGWFELLSGGGVAWLGSQLLEKEASHRLISEASSSCWVVFRFPVEATCTQVLTFFSCIPLIWLFQYQSLQHSLEVMVSLCPSAVLLS